MGRPKGLKSSVQKYHLKYLNDDNPHWNEYDCVSYNDICYILLNKHNIQLSRHIIQNIALQRRDKKNSYLNIKITKIE